MIRNEGSEATPPAILEQQILDSNVPKNEREWWAAGEIGRLREENRRLKAEVSRSSYHCD